MAIPEGFVPFNGGIVTPVCGLVRNDCYDLVFALLK